MDASPAHGAFSLGTWLVEPSLNRLTRADEVRHLRSRLMDLLVYLAQHAGRVVTKDQILENVWHQRFVAESVLSRSVAELRQLLGDEARHPRVIETIPKRGYRLVATVAEPARGASAGSVGADPRPSIVVLPFLDLAPARDHEYFCDGLAEELTNRLAHLRGLRVVARTSAFAFKGTAADVRDIARQLKVRAVLEGSVQRRGDDVRVTAQVVDASDGCHVWSGRFDRPARDIFAIEDEIAQAVVSALRVVLLGEAEGHVMRARRTHPAAHDLYLKGRFHAARRSPDGLERARQCFEQAIALDEGYAAAQAGIAECWCVSGFAGFGPPGEMFPRAKAAAERALAMDSGLAEAHAVLGHESGMFEWQWATAEHAFLRALDLSPGHSLTRVWYSHLLTAFGRFDEAITQTERACECDPLAPTVHMTLGLALYYARDYARAVERYRRALELDPSFALARVHLGRACAAQGDFAAAAAQYERAGRDVPLALGFLAYALRRLGRTEDADVVQRDLERLSRSRYVGPAVWLPAHAHDRQERLAWIARYIETHEGTAPLLNAEPMMDDLRGDPVFERLLARLGLPHGDRRV